MLEPHKDHRNRSPFITGIVQSPLDLQFGRVRVTFPDLDQVRSWPLPVVLQKTQNDKTFWMPHIGEQVVCLMDELHEDGVVLGSVYSTVDGPPAGMTADKDGN